MEAHIWTVPEIIALTLVGVGLIACTWHLEKHPGVWRKIEREFPLFGFGDSHSLRVDGFRPEVRPRPRLPTETMVIQGVEVLRQLDLVENDGADPQLTEEEAETLVRQIWVRMWSGFGERT